MPANRPLVPPALAGSLVQFHGAAGRSWIDALPELVASYLRRWRLRLAGTPRHGVVALVLPVVMSDGTPAALKLQPIDPDHAGEAAALRAWDGDGAVRVLEDDPETWTLLLERLDDRRDLCSVKDDLSAVQVVAELLARLTAHPAPPGIRRVSDVALQMIASVPTTAAALSDRDDARSLRRWAATLDEVVTDAGDRLLHWDLHYQNVLAGEREPWLAIDPKPVAGDPGFELLPALRNRWDDVVASGDVRRSVLRRFDLMVEVLGLDRERAVAWTLGRVLQNALWDIEDGRPLDDAQKEIAAAITS